MGEVKYSMKARVKILVNGAAATLLTGAVAAGLILSSTGALRQRIMMFSLRVSLMRHRKR